MAIYQKTVAKEIVSDKKVIQTVTSDTLKKMAEICGASLGPGGRPVLIERDGLSPLITKDGVTIAKCLAVDDAVSNLIIDSAKEICLNTAKEAGDGTTSAIIIANALVKNGTEFLNENPKYNPQKLVNEIKDAYDKIIVPYLKNNAIVAETSDQLLDVARISSNGDNDIANAVVEAVLAAGDDGTVLIEEGQDAINKVETIDGMIVTSGLKDLGQIGTAFINDNANQQVKMDNGVVFLYDGSMMDLKPLAAIQDYINGTELSGSPIIIFAHSFSDVVLNKVAKAVKGGTSIVPIKTPMSGLPNSRSMLLRDIAAYTGATICDPGNLIDFTEEFLGFFDYAKVSMFESFIMVNEPDIQSIENRVTELKSVMSAAKSEFDKSFLRAAIAKLTGGISTIWVGGTSEIEIREKKARVEDAVEAVRSAIAEGLIPGGCSVNVILHRLLNNHKDSKPTWKILAESILAPIEFLLSNCGENVNEILTSLQEKSIKNNKLPNMVFDANNHLFVNPFKKGIIEPAKVCRVSMANALSVATLLITLGGVVVVPRDKGLENQLALSDKAFSSIMDQVSE